MGLLYRIVLYFALINVAVSVLFDENDVRCSPDGSIHVKMMGRGNITARIHAFGENGPCRRRLLREDVLRFERQGQQGSPVRMIIDNVTPGSFKVIDVHCISRGLSMAGPAMFGKPRRLPVTGTRIRSKSRDLSIIDDGILGKSHNLPAAGTEVLSTGVGLSVAARMLDSRKQRNKRQSLGVIQRKTKLKNAKPGEEIDNTGLDINGNLVRDKDFSVSVGMVVNVPYSDNDEIDINCDEPGRIALSNPDPLKFRYFLAYNEDGDLCTVKVRRGRSRLSITNCDMTDAVKVAFNDRMFSKGIIGGAADLKVYKIDCDEILADDIFDELAEIKSDQNEYEYYYVYDYPSSCPIQTGTWQQIFLLVMMMSTVLFLERLSN